MTALILDMAALALSASVIPAHQGGHEFLGGGISISFHALLQRLHIGVLQAAGDTARQPVAVFLPPAGLGAARGELLIQRPHGVRPEGDPVVIAVLALALHGLVVLGVEPLDDSHHVAGRQAQLNAEASQFIVRHGITSSP